MTSAFGRKFLGYALWVAKGREVKCAVAKKALGCFFGMRISPATGATSRTNSYPAAGMFMMAGILSARRPPSLLPFGAT